MALTTESHILRVQTGVVSDLPPDRAHAKARHKKYTILRLGKAGTARKNRSE